VTLGESQTHSKIKPRKRAIDFLCDDEDKEGGVAAGKSTEVELPPAQKAKKKKAKKDKTQVDGEANGVAIPADSASHPTTDIARNVSKKLSGTSKAKTTKVDPKPHGGPVRKDNPATSSVPRKKGLSTVDVHAEKIKKLLGQKDDLPRPSNKANAAGNATSVSFTASGVNGESSSVVDEVRETAVEGASSSSLQAEGQRTTERELQDEYNSDEEIDQARALLEGFDSDTEDLAQDEGFDKENPTGAVPNYKKTQKKLRQAAQKGGKDGPGVVYVGRIPHGFFENEMRQYFSQFGTIKKLRLSRNRKTGQSKHFAFLEFDSNEVAKIVAEAMDNYLMFGHILKCKYVLPEALHSDTFKGANKRFRVAPHNRMEKRALEAPKSESQWKKKNSREQSRREKNKEKLKAMGYDMELPTLKDPNEVLQQRELQGAKEGEEASSFNADETEPSAPAPVSSDEDALGKKKSKKAKKQKPAEAKTNGVAAQAEDTIASTSDTFQAQNGPKPKSEKSKKREKKAKEEAKPLDAQVVSEKNAEAAKDHPAQTETDLTTAGPNISRPDGSSTREKDKKKKKKEKKKVKGEDGPMAVPETQDGSMANPETTSIENQDSPSSVPTGSVDNGKSKRKKRKSKGSGASNDLVQSERESNKPATKRSKGPKGDSEQGPKSIMKKAKKT
jgi:nucleolar protein 15